MALFRPDRAQIGDGLVELIISDYVAYYSATPTRERWGVAGRPRRESPERLALLFLPRMLFNPCLHATVLLRLAMQMPRFLLSLWRSVLISKHSIDIQRDIEIGPGLVLPHPQNIVFGWGVRVGRNATILHGVTLGGQVGQVKEGRMAPTLGDDVVVFPNSMLLGPISVGDEVVVGAGSWVDSDVSPGTVVPGSAALYSSLLSAEAAGPANP